MHRGVSKPLFLSLCLLPALASAMDIQPGLWEISSNTMQVGGQAVPGMEQMLEQMKNLPPEQRQMMEQMLAQQGQIDASVPRQAAEKYDLLNVSAGASGNAGGES